jgi:hypothetical protein
LVEATSTMAGPLPHWTRRPWQARHSASVRAIAITAVFSPLTSIFEERAADIVLDVHPEARITKSSTLGRIGLLERENAALLNAALAILTGCHNQCVKYGRARMRVGVSTICYAERWDGRECRRVTRLSGVQLCIRADQFYARCRVPIRSGERFGG